MRPPDAEAAVAGSTADGGGTKAAKKIMMIIGGPASAVRRTSPLSVDDHIGIWNRNLALMAGVRQALVPLRRHIQVRSYSHYQYSLVPLLL